jgi:hypothetical protein
LRPAETNDDEKYIVPGVRTRGFQIKWLERYSFPGEENMKVLALLLFMFSFSGVAIAAPATHKPTAWWGHSSNHHQGKIVRPHTGRRNLSTHPERRRRMK